MDDIDDIEYMSQALESGSTISGPWRLTVWEKKNSPTCYVFSEEHDNEGSCPEQKDIAVLAKDILRNTRHVHVFIEHFSHALGIKRVVYSEEQACSAKSESILNNMRNCLEVLRINRPEEKNRIHFVDPRMDIVGVLPDGKLYEAITHYTKFLMRSGNLSEALMTVYEAFIHPLLSIVPNKFGVHGRMTGVMERYESQMTEVQQSLFLRLWKVDIVERIKTLSETYVLMEKTQSLSRLTNLKLSYTDMVNKFMDMCLLAQFFVAQNKGMSAAVIYAGSLHSLNFETYLGNYGYTRTRMFENKSLTACIVL